MSAEKPRERPILFNDQMVRAILDGRKTVTRRVMKPQPVLDGHFWTYGGAGWSDRINSLTPLAGHSLAARCPYGQPGDRLWVREAWQGPLISDEEQAANQSWWKDMTKFQNPGHCAYRASGDDNEYVDPDGYFHCKWKPSIHMPRWASRILLEITAVRVERLQDISNDQAIAEGIDTHPMGFYGNGCITAGGAFLELWESINGDGRWADNPWVWVIEFKRVAP